MFKDIDRNSLTPMMQQYFDLKEKYDDCILLFRLGDFYEMFFDDAIKAAKILDLVLTKRDCGLEKKAPMCGLPHHVLNSYLPKLVKANHKAAIVEQLEDPKKSIGLVKRDVVRIISPGTIIGDELSNKHSNFIASISFFNDGFGIAYMDISTGEIYYTENYSRGDIVYINLSNALDSIKPSEVIVDNKSRDNKSLTKLFDNSNFYLNYLSMNDDFILKDYPYFSKSFYKNIKRFPLAEKALYYLLQYVHLFNEKKLNHFKEPVSFSTKLTMELDQGTRKNLNLNSKGENYSLFDVLNHTHTPMGFRKLAINLENPLREEKEIEGRLNLVSSLISSDLLFDIATQLDGVGDIERLVSRYCFGKMNARDLKSLEYSIESIESVKMNLLSAKSLNLRELALKIDDLSDIKKQICSCIIDEPPLYPKDGSIIKIGFSAVLDDMRQISIQGKDALVEFEIKERERTGIKNLKIVYNKKTGYFIDVTKANIHLIPEDYYRVQTLTNSDRYSSKALKDIEKMIFTAEEDTIKLEEDIFNDLLNIVDKNLKRIQEASALIANLDFSLSLAIAAVENNYVRPLFNDKRLIDIKEARHPIIEAYNPFEDFIANDICMDDKSSFQIITGPNMAGKSTYLRQTALISILAQIGSYVPASYANLPILDRIFTRIGASDNIIMGESTFMVEMKEISYILNNASSNSLILLDEVGRGTSTYDGLSIAWALVEHFVNKVNAFTLFATHYHELTKLEDTFDKIKNLSIQVDDSQGNIVFLHKIAQGSQSKSFGIEVAKLAGFPRSITKRASTILASIEKTHSFEIDPKRFDKQIDLSSYQRNIFIKKISSLQVDRLSPIEGLNTLYELVEEARILGDYNGD